MDSYLRCRSKLICAGVLAVLLAGCGGGGGSGAVRTGAASTSPPAVQATGPSPTLSGSIGTPIPLSGNALTVTTVAGVTTVAADSTVSSSRTINSATQAAINFSVNSTTRTAIIDLTAPSAGAANGVGVPAFQSRLNDGVLTTADSNAGTLSYTSFGYWIFQPTNALGAATGAATLQSYFGGRETPVSNMPNAGTASYTGRTLGFGATAGATFFLAGDVSLTANFAGTGVNPRTVSGSVTGISTSPALGVLPVGAVTPSSIVLSGGAISGNGFAGAATGFSGATNIGSGAFSGKFFGPTAQEVGGQWAFQGAAVSAVGSFGAKSP